MRDQFAKTMSFIQAEYTAIEGAEPIFLIFSITKSSICLAGIDFDGQVCSRVSGRQCKRSIDSVCYRPWSYGDS